MKKLFDVLIFANLFFCAVSAQAKTSAESLCLQNASKPEVIIEVSYGALKYDFSKNNKTLTRMHVRNYGGIVAPGKQVHGLASYDLATEITFQLQKSSFSNKTTCIYPLYVTLKVGVQNPTIYISRNLKEGSCAYQVALRHEQTHQQINAEIFEAYLPQIEQTFLNVVSQNALISSESDIDMAQVQKTLQAKYLEALDPVIEEIKSTIKQEQAKLDSIENYNYEESICK